jgi:hypothetical protein
MKKLSKETRKGILNTYGILIQHFNSRVAVLQALYKKSKEIEYSCTKKWSLDKLISILEEIEGIVSVIEITEKKYPFINNFLNSTKYMSNPLSWVSSVSEEYIITYRYSKEIYSTIKGEFNGK